ncbi:UDP-Glc:alpha-D-GlcNAc-diphosphoundecaprenol beta-1,3-glucosyltransferase WfgD [Marinomonas spartinae]|uniref:glycosyltransferase family 2 protein n=1 Tax=Marinomonas spartinae TaxID=1792290 RepID=UPI000808A1F1|nr:glycosyltransferase family 2 protein [Marinomonas spartinae]SBS38678.1 UDP-Glc:alpha-D-GlcNAc-diphosphoundecaprenol beta-1,3-glucosyltransferase WfgD [Marinomonas spartinae]
MAIANLVSIIMPVHQGQMTLIRALDSLFKQTYPNWECILIADDGFDYKWWLKQQGIQDIRLRFTQTEQARSGPNIARNVGKKLARGEWIAPLDVDDLYYPTRLAQLIPLAQASGLALDNVCVVNDDSQQTITMGLKQPTTQLSINDFFTTNTPLLFLFHHSLAQHNWEPIARGGDTLFNLRALETAGYATCHQEALHEYRVHKQSMCHAPNVGNIFDQAYQETLQRLHLDGLGFQNTQFKNKVIELITYKKTLNLAFEKAIENGFNGDFQAFSSTSQSYSKISLSNNQIHLNSTSL